MKKKLRQESESAHSIARAGQNWKRGGLRKGARTAPQGGGPVRGSLASGAFAGSGLFHLRPHGMQVVACGNDWKKQSENASQ